MEVGKQREGIQRPRIRVEDNLIACSHSALQKFPHHIDVRPLASRWSDAELYFCPPLPAQALVEKAVAEHQDRSLAPLADSLPRSPHSLSAGEPLSAGWRRSAAVVSSEGCLRRDTASIGRCHSTRSGSVIQLWRPMLRHGSGRRRCPWASRLPKRLRPPLRTAARTTRWGFGSGGIHWRSIGGSTGRGAKA